MLLAAAVGQLENDSPGGAKVRDSDTGEKPKDPDAMKPGGGERWDAKGIAAGKAFRAAADGVSGAGSGGGSGGGSSGLSGVPGTSPAIEGKSSFKLYDALMTRTENLTDPFLAYAPHNVFSLKKPTDYLIDPTPKHMLHKRTIFGPEGVTVTIYQPTHYLTPKDLHKIGIGVMKAGAVDHVPLNDKTRCFCRMITFVKCVCWYGDMSKAMALRKRQIEAEAAQTIKDLREGKKELAEEMKTTAGDLFNDLDAEALAKERENSEKKAMKWMDHIREEGFLKFNGGSADDDVEGAPDPAASASGGKGAMQKTDRAGGGGGNSGRAPVTTSMTVRGYSAAEIGPAERRKLQAAICDLSGGANNLRLSVHERAMLSPADIQIVSIKDVTPGAAGAADAPAVSAGLRRRRRLQSQSGDGAGAGVGYKADMGMVRVDYKVMCNDMEDADQVKSRLQRACRSMPLVLATLRSAGLSKLVGCGQSCTVLGKEKWSVTGDNGDIMHLLRKRLEQHEAATSDLREQRVPAEIDTIEASHKHTKGVEQKRKLQQRIAEEGAKEGVRKKAEEESRKWKRFGEEKDKRAENAFKDKRKKLDHESRLVKVRKRERERGAGRKEGRELPPPPSA